MRFNIHLIMKRFTQSIFGFPSGDWSYLTPDILVNSDIHIVDIEVLCKGDLNGTYIPFIGKTTPPVSLGESGSIYVEKDQDVIIPVRISSQMNVGAISLVMGYPTEVIDIVEISQGERSGGKFMYNVIGNEIRVAWTQTLGSVFNTDDAIVYVKARIKDYTKLGQVQFEVLEGSEIADAFGNVSFVDLNTPKLLASDHSVSVSVQPNPFSDRTSFVINTHESVAVEIWIYDLLGQKVQQVSTPDMLPAGTHRIDFDATTMRQGIYQYQIKIKGHSGSTSKTGKLILEK